MNCEDLTRKPIDNDHFEYFVQLIRTAFVSDTARSVEMKLLYLIGVQFVYVQSAPTNYRII
jgi:hypothetical protein